MIGQMNVHLRALKYVLLFFVAVISLTFFFTTISELGIGPYIFKYGVLVLLAGVAYFLIYQVAEMNLRHEKEDREMAELFSKDYYKSYSASSGSGGKEEVRTKTYTGEK